MTRRRALVAVYDKTGLPEFAAGLTDLGFEIVSTGGTAKVLRTARIPVTQVSTLTGFPEILDGRVKTLHPAVFGGILARRTPAHKRELARHGIGAFDLVAVNLYPFEATVSKRGVIEAEALEEIDIGGVALIRAAAKNFETVVVITSPNDYAGALERLGAGTDALTWRRERAMEAFALTSRYDAAIAAYFSRRNTAGNRFPDRLILNYDKALELHYGENPHQKAAYYAEKTGGLKQIAGPEPSYNNFLDLAAAAALAAEFEGCACAVVKHNSPCGVAAAAAAAEAFRRAWYADEMSAYGGIIAFNARVDMDAAEAMMTKGTFFHIVAAPSYDKGVVDYLRTAKAWTDRLRVFSGRHRPQGVEYRTALGGLLAQESDSRPAPRDKIRQVSGPEVDDAAKDDLLFAWAVAKHARSNAIVIVRDRTTLAIGAGQVNRLWPAEEAVKRVGDGARGAVAASDGFFPKPDSLEALCRAGIRAVVQPSGSKADESAIAAAQKYGVALFFADRRHFRH